ncbi:CDP-glycerol glycerophosphotransferase family protein [Anaerosporobacter sp.]|uniref:CDP-glycerol glycerophosphotransferase family protein n=1 Tax=Anaerosporobacter sp. TaxID=1872529 RepID=UPI00286FA7AE|nr:CDP-glycerol glycerophosphotransferase family protein [Anaerosporobacter sp.]
MIKKIMLFCGRCLFGLFCFFPIKNHIILYSYSGKKIEDSILLLYSECLKRNICVYFVYTKGANVDKNINTLKQYSLRYFYYAASAKIVITNVGIPPITVKRGGQTFINTWHGAGGLKGFGNDSVNYSFNIFDYFVSESKKDEEWFSRNDAWNFQNTYLETGMPRNDILLNSTNAYINSVKLEYGLSQDAFLLLYAPTWRDFSSDCFITEFENIRKVLCERFGKDVVVLYKRHHLQQVESKELHGVVDCSLGYDIQKLLLISDLLITDYSSCAWDFSLMKKPVALYIPDYDSYILNRGNSFIDYGILPYMKAKNIYELIKQLSVLDISEYKKCIDEFHNYMGVFNKEGNALNKIMNLCESILDGNNEQKILSGSE